MQSQWTAFTNWPHSQHKSVHHHNNVTISPASLIFLCPHLRVLCVHIIPSGNLSARDGTVAAELYLRPAKKRTGNICSRLIEYIFSYWVTFIDWNEDVDQNESSHISRLTGDNSTQPSLHERRVRVTFDFLSFLLPSRCYYCASKSHRTDNLSDRNRLLTIFPSFWTIYVFSIP
jgi:hypothetical protein